MAIGDPAPGWTYHPVLGMRPPLLDGLPAQAQVIALDAENAFLRQREAEARELMADAAHDIYRHLEGDFENLRIGKGGVCPLLEVADALRDWLVVAKEPPEETP